MLTSTEEPFIIGTANTSGNISRRVVMNSIWAVPVVSIAVGTPAYAQTSSTTTMAFTESAYSATQGTELSGVSVSTHPAAPGLPVTLTLSSGMMFTSSAKDVSVVVAGGDGVARFPSITLISAGTMTATSASATAVSASVTYTPNKKDLRLLITAKDGLSAGTAGSPGRVTVTSGGVAASGVSLTVTSTTWWFYSSRTLTTKLVTGSAGWVDIDEVFVPVDGGSSRFVATSEATQSNEIEQVVAAAAAGVVLYRVPDKMTVGETAQWIATGVQRAGTLQDGYTVTIQLSGPLTFADGTVSSSVAVDSSRPSLIGSVVSTGSGVATITATAPNATTATRQISIA